jgi:hypothetical protein
MIFCTTARVTDDPNDEHYKNQSFAFQSWLRVAEAVVVFGPEQAHLKSPITLFIPAEEYPKLINVVDFCADQEQWSMIINSDIVVMPVFKKLEKRLKDQRAAAFTSWRHTFDPKVGLEPRERTDNGLDLFGACPGAWAALHDKMGKTPQGWHDSPSHLRLGAPSWDSWSLGAFQTLFGPFFVNLTRYRCFAHPVHSGRKHGQGVPDVHHIGPCSMPERDLG